VELFFCVDRVLGAGAEAIAGEVVCVLPTGARSVAIGVEAVGVRGVAAV